MGSSIEKNADFKSPAQKAVEAKKPDNGPHTARAQNAMKKLADEKEAVIKAERGGSSGSGNAAIVDIGNKDKDGSESEDTKREKGKLTYSPKEVRDKAKAFMASGKLTPEEKRVLKEILGNESED